MLIARGYFGLQLTCLANGEFGNVKAKKKKKKKLETFFFFFFPQKFYLSPARCLSFGMGVIFFSVVLYELCGDLFDGADFLKLTEEGKKKKKKKLGQAR
jgi:hypothetical protein